LFGSAKPKFVAFLGSLGPDRAPSDSARVLIAEVNKWLGSFRSQALGIALAGLALGVAGSLACTYILANLLFGVQPMDLATTIGAATLLIVVALAAGYVPARRAANVDPTTALRVE
jgi:ABC-type lipoprotein release transport system permease subunit